MNTHTIANIMIENNLIFSPLTTIILLLELGIHRHHRHRHHPIPLSYLSMIVALKLCSAIDASSIARASTRASATILSTSALV